MAQPPLRVDALEIVGDSGIVPSALLEADATTGEMLLSDAVTSALKLADITGLQSISGVVIVGKSGSGMSTDDENVQVTTISQALELVPASATASSPWLVLVMSGVYIEDVFHDRDGVHMFGLGNVVIRNATATDTYTILEGPFSIPRKVTFQNIRFENVSAASAAMRLSSALYATGTATVSGITFVGDTFSIGGNTLTAIATGAVPIAGEFELGATFDDTATNLTAAINSSLNPAINVLVKASAALAVVTLQSQVPGLAGNATTLATSVPLTFVLSGATLAGGVDSAVASTLANDRISYIDCDLVATDATGLHFIAESVNNVYISGGNWSDSSTGAVMRVYECASLEVVDTTGITSLGLRYDTVGGGPLPSVATSSYSFRNVTATGATSYAADGGVGSLTVTGGSLDAFTFTGTGGEPLTSAGATFAAVALSGVASAIRIYNFDADSLSAVGSPALECGPGVVRGAIADDNTTTSTYVSISAAAVTCTLGGTWNFRDSSFSGLVTADSGTLNFQNCSGPTLTLTGTCACVWRNSNFVAITPTGAGPTLDIDELQVAVPFVGVASVVVPFPVEQPDALYHVYLDSPIVPAVPTDIPAVPARAVATFTITYGAVQATTVGATVRRFP